MSFKSNITKIEDDVFTLRHPYDAVKYEDSIENLIKYIRREYSAGVYLGQSIGEVKVPDLALLIKTNKDNSQSDSEFDMELLEWKENVNTTFGRRCYIKEGNKKLHFLFTYQCGLFLKTKLNGIKGYDKDHNAQDGMKLLDIINIIACGTETHLQVTWSMMKVNKLIYKIFRRRNTKNDDYMKRFEAYIKVIDSYGGKTPMHHVLVKSNIAKMGL